MRPHTQSWQLQLIDLGASLDTYPDCLLCTTTWGAVLSVEGIDPNLVLVSDPDCVDAGQYIGADEVVCLWKVTFFKSDHPPMYTDGEWAKIKHIF